MVKYKIEIDIDVDKEEWVDDDLNRETIKLFFEYGADKFKEQYKGVNSVQTSITNFNSCKGRSK